MAQLKKTNKSVPSNRPSSTTKVAKEAEQETKPVGKSKSGDPFAAKFNQMAKEQASFKKLPVGKWEALCFQAGKMEKDGKELAWLDWVITEEGDHEGEVGRSFFNLVTEDGDVHVGAAILARNLNDMGYMDIEEGIESMEQLEEILDDIENDPRWVIIHVKIKGGYTNIFLDSVMDNQDDKPEVPEKAKNDGDDVGDDD